MAWKIGVIPPSQPMERTEARELLVQLMARAFREAAGHAQAAALKAPAAAPKEPDPAPPPSHSDRGPMNPGQLGCRRHAGEIHAASSSPTSNGTDLFAILYAPTRTTVSVFPVAPG
jgi:hypothetical protein